ncbi:DUF4192 domain-containing protein [Streptomyces sp. NPDC052701]|uniref:DUF4192 domain-containing protein n=1 Tax=Streptomyces sp. NPDC052701 TaxID=3155533 RepID=UPI003432B8D2
MTNHSETTGSAENSDIAGGDRHEDHDGHPVDGGPTGRGGPGGRAEREANGGHEKRDPRPEELACTAYERRGGEHQVTLRTPGELADALPYLLGYRPEDSIVLVALHDRDGRGRFGGRARLGIPANPDDWPSASRQLAHGLVTSSERRGAKPEQMVAFLCQEPRTGESGRQVMERLRPLAQKLRLECGALDVPVVEALCISDGRFWSYCCGNEVCCPAEGTPMGLPGTSVLAAAATYAGIQVRGTLRELRARLLPWETSATLEQEIALDSAGMTLVPRMLDDAGRTEVAEQTLRLAGQIMGRLAEAPPASGPLTADLQDDKLVGHDEAAALILGLQDRTTRDRAAEWMEGDEAGPALRLWRALARRCVGPYGEHAAAPLTLVGWVAWSAGDELEAREALAMALGADPDYLFARLLHQACNEGLDPESIRRCLRTEREDRKRTGTGGPAGRDDAATPEALRAAGSAADTSPARHRRRTRPAGAAHGVSRRLRAGRSEPGTRIPHPRTPAAGTRPGSSATGSKRSGGAAGGGTRPGGPRRPAPEKGVTRRRAAGKGSVDPRARGAEGEE